MRFVFVMDPVSTVIFDKDTSFALMREAEVRGHEVFHCMAHDVELSAGTVRASVRSCKTEIRAQNPITLGKVQHLDLSTVDAVFVRKDPPFDDQYLWLTLILEHVKKKTLVLNDPQGLRTANEKLYACWFPELMPPHVVCSSKETINAFVDAQGGSAVIKPIDGYGGGGILFLSKADKNFNAIIENMTRSESRSVMVQKYLPEIDQGDKRILVLDGQPLGCFTRIPQRGDFRSNLRVGGSAHASELSDADRKILSTVGPRLQQEGLHFVGLDVIGGYLSEINVTSPTGIQQMSKITGENLPAKVIAWVELRIKR